MAIQRSTHPSADVLKAYAQDQLDDNASAAVRNHLDHCDACRQQAATLERQQILDRETLLGRTPTPQGPTTLFNVLPEVANHPDYEVLRELGRGGMGIVYLSRHRLSGRLEVLKVMNKALLGQAANSKERFLREIQAAARLDHKNVVKMYTALELGELMVLVMEYVPGEDLAQVLKARGALPVLNACYYVQQAASGLQHAFEKGMIHRDIKPQNLILAREGKKHVVKVLDFGLAKGVRGEEADTALTGTGAVMGTPGYVAPEQSLNAAEGASVLPSDWPLADVAVLEALRQHCHDGSKSCYQGAYISQIDNVKEHNPCPPTMTVRGRKPWMRISSHSWRCCFRRSTSKSIGRAATSRWTKNFSKSSAKPKSDAATSISWSRSGPARVLSAGC